MTISIVNDTDTNLDVVFTLNDKVRGLVTLDYPRSADNLILKSLKVHLHGGIFASTDLGSESAGYALESSPRVRGRQRRLTQTTFLNSIWNRQRGSSNAASETTSMAELKVLVDQEIELLSEPQHATSKTKFPFEFSLVPLLNTDLQRAQDLQQMYGNQTNSLKKEAQIGLLDTYHGQALDILYSISYEASLDGNHGIDKSLSSRRQSGLLGKLLPATVTTVTRGIKGEQEIFVRNIEPLEENRIDTAVPYPFILTEHGSLSSTIHDANPVFSMHGYIDNISITPNDPLTGWYQIERGGDIVSSVEIRLCRIERIATDRSLEKSEVMKLNLADGPIHQDFRLPIFMAPYPWLVCPSMDSRVCGVSFELHIAVKLSISGKITVLGKAIPLQYRRCVKKYENSMARLFGIR